MAERVDEYFLGHPADESIDHVSIGDVGKLVALLGEALDILLEGLVGPLPTVVEVLGVPRSSVHTLEVIDEDGTELAPAANAAGLELLEPSSSQAR